MQNRSVMVELFLVLALFTVFVVSSVILITMGGNVYSDISVEIKDNYSQRVSLSYVATRIRQADAGGKISMGKIGQTDSLIIEESYDTGDYDTYIYYYEGKICELTSEKGFEVFESDGEGLIEVESFTMEELEDGFFAFSAGNSRRRTLKLLIGADTV